MVKLLTNEKETKRAIKAAVDQANKMKKDVKVIKNLLPPIFLTKLKNILTAPTFPWSFIPSTTAGRHEPPDAHFMFTHMLYHYQENSLLYQHFEPILYYLADHIKLQKVIRMKVNLYPNQNKVIEHASHIDINQKDKATPNVTVSILNFTTCNGGTRIGGKKYPSNENEVLSFDNLTKHSGIVQTDTQRRIVLNIATA